jgi:ribonuclease-3
MGTLCRRIGYDFREPRLLRQALTHRSHSHPNNERLEFLGDSVLNYVIAAELYRLFPDLSEGELSTLRANLVNQGSLAQIAQQISLGAELLLGEGELRSGGQQRASVLADALEALFGALVLDGGFAEAQRVILDLFSSRLKEIDPRALTKDAKTALQEYLQALRLDLPKYNVIATRGAAHEQEFEVECVINRLGIRTVGQGRSRRAAEQVAAAEAYRLALGLEGKGTSTVAPGQGRKGGA